MTIATAGYLLNPNAERHLKSPEEMIRLFDRWPHAIAATREFADSLHFSLDELRYEYPRETVPEGRTPQQHLEHLTWEGAKQRWPDGIPDKVLKQLNYELPLIEKLDFARYFLTVHDIVAYARGSTRRSCARAADRRRTARSAIASGSPRSIRRQATSCSSASSPRNGASRPTSTSISSTSGARR